MRLQLQIFACAAFANILPAQTESLPAPSLISPVEGVELHNVPRDVWFEWAAVPNAETYNIEIDCEHCCVQGRFCSEVEPARTFRASGLKSKQYRFEWFGDQRGRWRVWASAGFVEGEKSPWRMLSYRTSGIVAPPPAPQVIAPVSNAVLADGSPVTFEWSPVFGARTYTLEIDPQGTCALYKYCTEVGVYSITENITGTRYQTSFPSQMWTRWRVWAVSGDRISLKSPWTMFRYSSDAAIRPVRSEVAGANSQAPNQTTPAYSDAAAAAGLEGVATVYYEVDPSGVVGNVKILQGLGLGLNEKAVDLVRTWRFAPGAPPIGAAEIPFRLNGPGNWRVRRASYRIIRELRNEPDGIKPVLTSYARPGQACGPGEHWIVELSLRVGVDGRPTDVRENGQAGSRSGLRAAVAGWRFAPATADGARRAADATFVMECGDSQAIEANSSPGGAVKPPSIISKMDPEYSQAARMAKFNGSVAVALVVDADGFPTQLRIPHPIGLGLDEKALDAVKQWRFGPAIRNGHPVAQIATIEINFRLL